MKVLIQKYFIFIFLLLVFLLVFRNVVFQVLFPVPADALTGLYHPFRDIFAADFPNGIPFKNMLITDPVRQIIPWKELSVQMLSAGQIPLWNPYEMAGKPLLGNIQSSPFYPLNIFLVLQPFYIWWSVFVLVQLPLAAIFMYMYLRNLDLNKLAILFGIVSYIFSGFFTAWFEWGTILHTVLWLPLILLSIDKIIDLQTSITKFDSYNKRFILWSLVYLLSVSSALFAGHLQSFFYIFITAQIYFLFKLFNFSRKLLATIVFLLLNISFLILTAVQWYPSLRFIQLSSRALDQSPHTSEGWFLPWEHLAQFAAPDFFGNITTLNYFGTWNYGELVGYSGIVIIPFVLLAVIFSRRRTVLFFAVTMLLSFVLMLPSPVSALPFNFEIPFLSTAQPTRLMVLVGFSISVLASYGVHTFVSLSVKQRKKAVIISGLVIAAMTSALWFFVTIIPISENPAEVSVTQRNLILPTLLAGLMIIFLITANFVHNKRVLFGVLIFLLFVHTFDMTRFFLKFQAFTSEQYFYPNSKIISRMQNDNDIFRIASLDRSILPPNTATYYRLQSIEGYDPLYLQTYAEYIAALDRGKADIDPPYGYNRIITPRNIRSPLFKLLNVKYVMTFDVLKQPGYSFIEQEGKTKLYENTELIPRVFFVSKISRAENKNDMFGKLYGVDLKKEAVVYGLDTKKFSVGSAKIVRYSENSITIETQNSEEGFLVLLDAFYPTWQADIDGKQSRIHQTNHLFRGIVVPKGNHTVTFTNTLL